MDAKFTPAGYQTPEDFPRSRSFRWIPLPTLVFHLQVLLRSYRYARLLALKGKFRWEHEYIANRRIAETVEKSGGRIRVTGMEPFADPDLFPVVFVANHMSALDTFLLPAIVAPYTPLTYVVKASLHQHFYLGCVLQAIHSIPVSRDNPRDDFKKVMTEGCKRLEAGISVCIFPQTTRLREFDVPTFNSLASKLAHRAGVPLLPVALKTDLWGVGKLKALRDLGRIHPNRPVNVAFAPPLGPELSAKETHATSTAFIAENLSSWGIPVQDA